MAIIDFQCAYCNTIGQKSRGEYNRSEKIGRHHFCSRSCAAQAANFPRKSKEITLICPGCEKQFNTTTHNKAKQHCSRSCASKISMSEKRREAQREGGYRQIKNLITAAEALKLREKWKYAALREVLIKAHRQFEFEYKLENRVFDLALLDTKVLIEFDGPHHKGAKQYEDDKKKDQIAKNAGFIVIRRPVPPSVVIDPKNLEGL